MNSVDRPRSYWVLRDLKTLPTWQQEVVIECTNKCMKIILTEAAHTDALAIFLLREEVDLG